MKYKKNAAVGHTLPKQINPNRREYSTIKFEIKSKRYNLLNPISHNAAFRQHSE